MSKIPRGRCRAEVALRRISAVRLAERIDEKDPAILLGGWIQFREFPLGHFRNATGIEREKVVYIDHSCGKTWASSKSVSQPGSRGASLDVSHLFGSFLGGGTVSQRL